MRRLLVLLAIGLLVPQATAHVGSDVWPLRFTETVVTPEDQVHTFPLLYPSSYREAGDILSLSVLNEGPADLTLRLLVDDVSVEEWALPASNNVANFPHVLSTLGKFQVQFESQDASQSAAVGFFFDADALCDGIEGPCVKRLPYELGGGLMVAPLESTGPGLYRTTVLATDLHELEYSIWSLDSNTVIPVEVTGGRYDTIEWETEQAGTHRLLITSTNVDAAVYDDEEDPIAAYDTQRIEVSTTGPFSRGIPAPAPLLAVAVLLVARARFAY